MRRRLLVALMGIGAAMLAPTLAEERTPWPWPSEVFNAKKRTDVAGAFDYYLLVLSWSPTHCLSAAPGRDDMQCARRDGKRYGFILHGLWPQYENGYPDACRTAWRPFVPEPVIASMREIMPSRGLVIHEYRAHGTCSGLRPAAYFALARQFYNRIKIPQRYQNPLDMQFVQPHDVLADFLSANPGLKPDMITVMCGGPGNRMSEVRVCMSRDGRFRRCSASALPRAPCRAGKLNVPPVRSTWRPGRGPVLGGPDAVAPRARPPIIESPRY
jgi:ribonuclease T2